MSEITAILRRWQNLAMTGGVVFLLLTGVGVFTGVHATCVSYLFAYLFWVLLALGCLLVTMLHCLARGDWGIVTRRIFEAGAMTMPVMAILFLPLCFGLHQLYPWADATATASDPVLKQKAMYDNPAAFILRAFIFFALVIGLVMRLRQLSLRQDSGSDSQSTINMRTLSGPAIVIVPFAASFVLVDWVMSIETGWYSTIFPVILMAGGVLSAFAFAIILLAGFQKYPPFKGVVIQKHFHDLGNLLLTFVMFWTYVSFSQWLVSYSGNLPHETGWYVPRTSGSWRWLIWTIVILYFFMPFFVLLSRSAKQNSRALRRVAVLILVMGIPEIFWTVEPTFYPRGIRLHWTDITAWLGIGGIWLGVFARQLANAPLLIQQLPAATSLEPVPNAN